MTIPKDYQKMFRRRGSNGRTLYDIAQMYRPPEYKELYLVGWMSLPSHLESNVVSQNIGESQEDFYARLERECKVSRVQEEPDGPCQHERSFGKNIPGKSGLYYFCTRCGVEVPKPE